MSENAPLRLVAIGHLGNYTVYVDISREEAIVRHDREHPDCTVEEQGLAVEELVIPKGEVFYTYKIESEP